jgi:hypothetical protein
MQGGGGGKSLSCVAGVYLPWTTTDERKGCPGVICRNLSSEPKPKSVNLRCIDAR